MSYRSGWEDARVCNYERCLGIVTFHKAAVTDGSLFTIDTEAQKAKRSLSIHRRGGSEVVRDTRGRAQHFFRGPESRKVRNHMQMT